MEQLRHMVENYLDEFNNAFKKPMHLVVFRFEIKKKLEGLVRESGLVPSGGQGQRPSCDVMELFVFSLVDGLQQ